MAERPSCHCLIVRELATLPVHVIQQQLDAVRRVCGAGSLSIDVWEDAMLEALSRAAELRQQADRMTRDASAGG